MHGRGASPGGPHVSHAKKQRWIGLATLGTAMGSRLETPTRSSPPTAGVRLASSYVGALLADCAPAACRAMRPQTCGTGRCHGRQGTAAAAGSPAADSAGGGSGRSRCLGRCWRRRRRHVPLRAVVRERPRGHAAAQGATALAAATAAAAQRPVPQATVCYAPSSSDRNPPPAVPSPHPCRRHRQLQAPPRTSLLSCSPPTGGPAAGTQPP